MTGADLIELIKEKKLEKCNLIADWPDQEEDQDKWLATSIFFEGTEKFPHGFVLVPGEEDESVLLWYCGGPTGFKEMINTETLKEEN